MERIHMLFLIIITLSIIGCSNENPIGTSGDQLNKGDGTSELFKSVSNFQAHLNGGEEVPSVNTNAQGQALFRLSSDGSSIYYKVIASNIEDILMAHIHLGQPGAIGGIVVWLYPEAPPPQLISGRHDGILAEGTITDSNLVGALEGMTLADLISEIMDSNAYVNVHTTANPGGEIRGQIK